MYENGHDYAADWARMGREEVERARIVVAG
jgi:hypothetical protein